MKWSVILFLLSVLLAGASAFSLKANQERIVKHTYNILEIVLDSKLSEIKRQDRVLIRRGEFELNLLMLDRLDSLGETGESYIVRETYGKNQCVMISESIFPDYQKQNINGRYDCTDHWLESLNQGHMTHGVWTDYRQESVYGVGKRFARITNDGLKFFSVIVEKDVAEVKQELLLQQRTYLIVFLSLEIAFIAICIGGYISDRRAKRSAVENKTTLENVTSGIARVDKKRIVVSANPAMARMFGYESPDDLVGKQADMLFPEKHLEADVSSFRRMYAGAGTEEDRKINLEGLRKDGSTFPVQITRHIVTFSGEPEVLKVFVDMQKEVEARERIERKNAMMQQIGYLWRHDAIAAISPASLAIEYMIEAGFDQDALEIAHKELQAGMKMFQDLAEWSRSLDDSEQINKERHDLNELINSVLVDGVNIKVDKLVSIECSSGLFMAAARNVINNSVLYAKDEVFIHIYMDGMKLVFEDRSGGFGCNNGVYDAELAERLAQPGQRGRPDVEGSGLGIANTRLTVESHGWKFSWETDCKAGSTKWIFHLA